MHDAIAHADIRLIQIPRISIEIGDFPAGFLHAEGASRDVPCGNVESHKAINPTGSHGIGFDRGGSHFSEILDSLVQRIAHLGEAQVVLVSARTADGVNL